MKEYLLSFGIERLEQTGKEHNVNGEKIKARKKTSNKWFETQDSISYWEDFYKPKLFYADITQRLNFCICNEVMFCNNTTYFIATKSEETLEYLYKYLNSPIADWYYRTKSVQLGEKAVRMFSIYMLEIPIPPMIKDIETYKLLGLTPTEVAFIEDREY